MKVLIVSDTHKSHRNLEKIIEREQPFQMLIHLGDVEGGEDILKHWQTARYILCGEIMTFFRSFPASRNFSLRDGIFLPLTDITMVCLWGRKG